MAVNLNTLIIKKGDTIIDSYASGFATGEISFPAVIEVKDYAAKECPGEDGERVFFPDRAYYKPYDLDIEFKYVWKSNSAKSIFLAFCDIITGKDGKGTELSIYSPWYRIGRQKVYVKAIKTHNYRSDDKESFFRFTVTFRITDPITDIVLSVD